MECHWWISGRDPWFGLLKCDCNFWLKRNDAVGTASDILENITDKTSWLITYRSSNSLRTGCGFRLNGKGECFILLRTMVPVQ
jgi:hypothetical protein